MPERYQPSALVSGALLGVLSLTSSALGDDRMLLYDSEGLAIRAHFQAGLNGVAEQNLFWNFADTVTPGAGIEPDKQWLEGYIKPGLSFNKTFDERLSVYGKVSAVASGTLGIDAYENGNTGRITLEEAHLGLRMSGGEETALDLSFGPREFKVGTGMLIANGGNSGFERGALKFGPRKAWKTAAIGRLEHQDWTGSAFYLQPNELPDSSSGTTVLGADLRYNPEPGNFVGMTIGHVLKSTSPYPKAAPGGVGPPTILPNGRDGLNFVNAYAIGTPFPDRFENVFAGAELAYEWNDRIDMSAWAGRFHVGYRFADIPWSPTLALAYQTFSGDDPSTPGLERFDPLFFEGSPSAWSTGSKSSMVFINSNVSAYHVSLRMTPTRRDTLTLRYAHIRANELRSPIQFGQGTRVETSGNVPSLVAGVTDHHLSDDVFLEYSRVLNENTFLTAGASVSFPGRGIDSATNGNAPNWIGGFVNVVVNF